MNEEWNHLGNMPWYYRITISTKQNKTKNRWIHEHEAKIKLYYLLIVLEDSRVQSLNMLLTETCILFFVIKRRIFFCKL
jgi:hypothetical protein